MHALSGRVLATPDQASWPPTHGKCLYLAIKHYKLLTL